MSRRRAADKREVLPDAKFGDIILTKFINCLMYHGKKSTAEAIVYDALDRVSKRAGGQEPVRMFHDALGNVRPSVEVRSRRVGGATYRCRSRFGRSAAGRWRSAGSSRPRGPGRRTRCRSACRANCSTRPTIAARR